MSNREDRIKLDVFSLNWLGTDPERSRSAGMMSVSYNEPLQRDKMKKILYEIFDNYHLFGCNLEYDGKYYYLKIPETLTEEDLDTRFHFRDDIDRDQLFNQLENNEINLFKDDLWQIYLLDHSTSFDIVIYGSHLVGDGLTSATGLSIILNNYFAEIQGLDTKIFPEVEYKQLLDYAYKMKYNRFGKMLWVPRWFRFIPGYFHYRKTTSFDVPNQVFDGPVPLEEPLVRDTLQLNDKFNRILDILKEQKDINSNHLIIALISYAHQTAQDYERSIATYPINIRNQFGFEAGNLVTVNRIDLQRGENFLEHLDHLVELLDEEKNNSGPYYAISIGKFIKNDYDEVKKRMEKVVYASNLRFSNVGRLPAGNLDIIDQDVFAQIPISDYYANALPLGAIGVHFFITSIKNNHVDDYYLTILHSKDTQNAVEKAIDGIYEMIDSLYDQISNTKEIEVLSKS